MPTNIRPELSKKKPYYVERHRYYELKHFCLQWKTWQRYLNNFEIRYPHLNADGVLGIRNPSDINPTAEEAERRERYKELCRMVQKATVDADDTIAKYILTAVTNGLSYDTLRVSYNIPCGREHYYNSYRKFFWLLDKARR